MDSSERRLAEALRAQVSGTGGAGSPRPASPPRLVQAKPSLRAQIAWALLLGLLAGAVLGCALALLSLLAPGLLPVIG